MQPQCATDPGRDQGSLVQTKNRMLEVLRHELQSRRVAFGPNSPDEGLNEVIARGQPFIGIERPKGFRHQMKAKNCFCNAGRVATQERATYVEGFVLSKEGSLFPHGWLTLDGVHAIDQTLHAPEYLYYGISFTRQEHARAICAGGYHWGPLLESRPVGPASPEEIAAAKAETARIVARLRGQRGAAAGAVA
jgi:hypothetical protein